MRKFFKWFLLLLLVAASALAFFLLYSTNVTGNTDEYIYELPFPEKEQHRIVQGYGGLFSHSHIAALDFEMPEGNTVCAAREGVVYSYKDKSEEGGMFSDNKRKANYLIIRHDDGSYGCYWHLQQNGVLVKKGRVEKGQKIALSGATGQVIQPHLHFSVKRKLTYDSDSFVKTKFRTSRGITLLKTWNSYRKP